jgi:hypothetical protein
MLSLEQFNKRLETEFGGRLRARRAPTSGDIHIEEKRGRGIFDPPLPPHKITPKTARLQFEKRERARDGFAFVMAIAPGDRIPCPTCHLPLRLSVMEIKEAVCEYCRGRNVDTSVMTVYFPLGESLIDHLKKIDPLNDGVQRQIREVEQANTARQKAIDKAAEDTRYDLLKDAILQQLPSVGYTGKEQF